MLVFETNLKARVSIKDLDRSRLSCVKDVPVEDRVVRHQAKMVLAIPFPEQNVLAHGGRLESLTLIQIEDLQRSLLGLEGDDQLVPVHDGAVSLDRSTGDIIVVVEVDDDDLWLGVIIEPLTNADESVRFQRLYARLAAVKLDHRAQRRSLTHELKPMDAGYGKLVSPRSHGSTSSKQRIARQDREYVR